MQPYFKVVLSGAWHWIPLAATTAPKKVAAKPAPNPKPSFPTDAEINVTQGPSEDALTRGTTIILDNGLELSDDTLTEEEIELICGVYKWSTGMCGMFE